MSKFKTILYGDCAIGPIEYRATSNGIIVNLQEWHIKNKGYKTAVSCSKKEFDSLAESVDLYNPYKCKATGLKKIIGLLISKSY